MDVFDFNKSGGVVGKQMQWNDWKRFFFIIGEYIYGFKHKNQVGICRI